MRHAKNIALVNADKPSMTIRTLHPCPWSIRTWYVSCLTWKEDWQHCCWSWHQNWRWTLSAAFSCAPLQLAQLPAESEEHRFVVARTIWRRHIRKSGLLPSHLLHRPCCSLRHRDGIPATPTSHRQNLTWIAPNSTWTDYFSRSCKSERVKGNKKILSCMPPSYHTSYFRINYILLNLFHF